MNKSISLMKIDELLNSMIVDLDEIENQMDMNSKFEMDNKFSAVDIELKQVSKSLFKLEKKLNINNNLPKIFVIKNNKFNKNAQLFPFSS